MLLCTGFLILNWNSLKYYIYPWTHVSNFKSVWWFNFENNDAKVKPHKKSNIYDNFDDKKKKSLINVLVKLMKII